MNGWGNEPVRRASAGSIVVVKGGLSIRRGVEVMIPIMLTRTYCPRVISDAIMWIGLIWGAARVPTAVMMAACVRGIISAGYLWNWNTKHTSCFLGAEELAVLMVHLLIMLEARINAMNNLLDDVTAVAWSTDQRCRWVQDTRDTIVVSWP